MLIHRSPALTAIYNEIQNSDRNRILDLGPMTQGCFRLFSELSCKIQVEDLASHIRERLTDPGNVNGTCIDGYVGEYREADRFDVVLVWDLFNYLSLDEIKRLFDILKPYCKPNTLVYMLRYVEKKIPVVPREFIVRDKYLLELSEVETGERRQPLYSTMQLLSSMPGYFMQDTLMGQLGMLPGITEHVLRFGSTFESKHLISKSETTRTPQLLPKSEDSGARRHHSPAIADVLSLLQSDDDVVVLDLGSSFNRPEDAIVKNAKAYYRADIYTLLERSRKKGIEELNLSVLNYELSRKFDVILAWDILNYCSPAQVKQLDRSLSALSHENTFLLSFMYTSRNRPLKPSRFELLDDNSIGVGFCSDRVKCDTPLTGVSLMRLLQGFSMDKTYAYRSGMDREIIEYIFAYKDQSSQVVTPTRSKGRVVPL